MLFVSIFTLICITKIPCLQNCLDLESYFSFPVSKTLRKSWWLLYRFSLFLYLYIKVMMCWCFTSLGDSVLKCLFMYSIIFLNCYLIMLLRLISVSQFQAIFLPQPPECWDWRHSPLYLAHFHLLKGVSQKANKRKFI
jgi:hypothetical protein